MKAKLQLQSEAADRATVYAMLTLDEKIAQCKNRRGESKRELARLLAQKDSK